MVAGWGRGFRSHKPGLICGVRSESMRAHDRSQSGDCAQVTSSQYAEERNLRPGGMFNSVSGLQAAGSGMGRPRALGYSLLALACCVGLVFGQLIAPDSAAVDPILAGNCSTVNTSLCVPCSPGTFYNNDTESCFCCSSGSCADSSDCSPCQEGQYQPQPGQLSCAPCPQGSFSNSTASSTCLSCQPGSYANETGSTVCRECEKGYYATDQNSIFCLPCEEGSFCNTGGCNMCQLCPDGAEASSEATINCTLCSPGMFKGPGDTACMACGAGEYQTAAGSASCDQCPADHYCPSPDVNPIECPSDAFCPAGSSEPEYCMETFFRKSGDTCELAPLTIVLLTICAVLGLLLIGLVIIKWKQSIDRSVNSSLAPLLQKPRTRPKVYGVVCDAEPVYAGW